MFLSGWKLALEAVTSVAASVQHTLFSFLTRNTALTGDHKVKDIDKVTIRINQRRTENKYGRHKYIDYVQRRDFLLNASLSRTR